MQPADTIDPLACLPQQCRHGVSCEAPCSECDEEDIAPEAVAEILGEARPRAGWCNHGVNLQAYCQQCAIDNYQVEQDVPRPAKPYLNGGWG